MARPAKPAVPSLSAARHASEPRLGTFEVCLDGALSVEDCAAFCGKLSRDEIEKAINAGEIETFNRGKRVLIAKREAVRWLACMLDAHAGGAFLLVVYLAVR